MKKVFSSLILILMFVSPSKAVQIGNDLTRFTLNEENGFRLIGMEHIPSGTKFISGSLEGESVWKVTVRDAAKKKYAILGMSGGSIAKEKNANGSVYILTWKNADIEDDKGVLDVKVTIKVPANSALTYWNISVVNRSKKYALWTVDFPRLPRLGPLGDPQEDAFLAPIGLGILYRNPYETIASRWVHSPGYMQFQMCALYNEKKAGLYYAIEDGNGFYKQLNYAKSDDTTTATATGVAMFQNSDSNLAADATVKAAQEKKHIEVYLTNFPEGQGVIGTNYDMPYDVAIGTFTGDWWTAAKWYRQWAVKQVWCSKGKLVDRKDIPDWYKETAIWEFIGGGDYNGMLNFRNKIGMNWVNHWNYMWKEPGQGDKMSPDLFPPTGGEKVFREQVKRVQEKGVKVIPYFLGGCLDIKSPQYKEWNVEPHVVRYENGDPYIWHLHDGEWLFPWPCPYTKFWQEKVAEISRKIVDLGVDGVYYDTISGNGYQCFSSQHGHTVGGGNYWFKGNRELFRRSREEIRKVNPQAIMTSEGASELYLDLLDGNLFYGQIREGYVPAFQAIYHDYTFGYGISLATPKTAGKDYPLSLPIGLVFIEGDQIGWTAITSVYTKTEHSKDLAFIRKLAHFRVKCAQKFLGLGEMVRPPTFDTPLPIVSGDLGLSRGIVEAPAVLHSAWKAKDGNLGIIFLNISKQPQTVSCQFIAKDYGFKPDVQMKSYVIGLDSSEKSTREAYKVFLGQVTIKKQIDPLEIWALELTQED